MGRRKEREGGKKAELSSGKLLLVSYFHISTRQTLKSDPIFLPSSFYFHEQIATKRRRRRCTSLYRAMNDIEPRRNMAGLKNPSFTLAPRLFFATKKSLKENPKNVARLTTECSHFSPTNSERVGYRNRVGSFDSRLSRCLFSPPTLTARIMFNEA